TLEDQPTLHGLVATYQSAIERVPGLEPIPANWLHLTLQGIGFVDEISTVELGQVADAIQRRLKDVPVPAVVFHRPVVRPEAIYLPAEPATPIRAVRSAVRSSIAEILGEGRLQETQDQVQAYRPHVSVAYVNTAQPAEPAVEALSPVRTAPVTVVLRHVSLL